MRTASRQAAPGFSARRTAVCAVLLLLVCASVTACGDAPDSVLVLAAASTIDAMEAAVADYTAEGDTVEVSFASTSVLARQIEEGAPADIMLSASTAWADYVAERVAVARRAVVARNRLVVVVPADSTLPDLSLDQVAADQRLARIAIADPTSVPAGIYMALALRQAGLWVAVRPRLLPAIDVRAALALVADGEADAGFVYASDAAATPAVRVITRIDPGLHDPIEYPLVLLGDASPEAERFFEFLVSTRGRAHFHDRGFTDAGG